MTSPRLRGPRPPQPARTAPERPQPAPREPIPARDVGPRDAPAERRSLLARQMGRVPAGSPPVPAGRGAKGYGARESERRMGELVRRGSDRTFEKAFDHVLEVEGGYVNDPDDPGGETIYGISRRAYPDAWREGRPTQAQAYAIYRDIWSDSGAKAIASIDAPGSDKLAIAVFDAAVNHGSGRAAVLLQRAAGAGLRQDGKIGPATLRQVEDRLRYDTKSRTLLSDLRTERTRFYHRITARNPRLTKFYRGWMKRLTKLDDVTAGRK